MSAPTSTTGQRGDLAARTRRRSGRGWGRTVLALAILAVLLFPLYWMLNASFTRSSDLLTPNPSWFPVEGTLDGYRKALATQGANLVSSLVIALGTVVVSLALALPAAYALVRFRLRWSWVFVFALMVVQMIPTIVMATSLFEIFSHLGLVDNYLGLILADSTAAVPFAIIIVRAFMEGIPPALFEAAQLDGAGYWRTFFSVVLPVSRNAVVTAGLFSFLFAWADFLFGVTLTTGQSFRPITVGIYQFIGAQTSDWNGILATAVIASIPAVVLLIFAQRYIAAGVTGGAVKD